MPVAGGSPPPCAASLLGLLSDPLGLFKKKKNTITGMEENDHYRCYKLLAPPSRRRFSRGFAASAILSLRCKQPETPLPSLVELHPTLTRLHCAGSSTERPSHPTDEHQCGVHAARRGWRLEPSRGLTTWTGSILHICLKITLTTVITLLRKPRGTREQCFYSGELFHFLSYFNDFWFPFPPIFWKHLIVNEINE